MLFAFDALSMYTIIPTDYNLEIMSKHLRENEGNVDYHAETLKRVVKLSRKTIILILVGSQKTNLWEI